MFEPLNYETKTPKLEGCSVHVCASISLKRGSISQTFWNKNKLIVFLFCPKVVLQIGIRGFLSTVCVWDDFAECENDKEEQLHFGNKEFGLVKPFVHAYS